MPDDRGKRPGPVSGRGDRQREGKPRKKVQVPVGIEKVLYHAARDEGFRELLLADRDRALDEIGLELRPFERAMLDSVSTAALGAMVDRLVPENPRRRRFMGLVAAAAASLAAGTAIVSCDDDDDTSTMGVGPDTDVDGGTDTETDTSTVDTDTGPPDSEGMTIGDDIDGDFTDWPGWDRGRGGEDV